jgi:FkbM family methyltransferase
MNFLLGAVRRLATVPLVRRLTSVTPLLRLSYSLRATLVEERVRFVRNELRGPVTATYHLRESGIAVAIRHRTGDVMVLDEIFSQHEYEPPPGVELRAAVGRAVDLGANIGLFGAWLLPRCPGVEVVAYEADPANAAVHRLAIEANGLEDRWRLVEAFAGVQEGTTGFTTGLHAVSHEGEGIEVPVVDVLPQLADADLVKIDIEGAEWPILADARFRELRAEIVVLEYHPEGSPQPDPARAAAEALAGAGYETVPGPTKEAYGAGLLWGVRRSAQRRP